MGGVDEHLVAACRKDRTRQILGSHGVQGPRFAVESDWPAIERAAAGIGYPLVVKQVDLCGGMFVRRVDDGGQLRTAVQEIGAFRVNARGQLRPTQILLEELLTGPEFSVETITRGGHTTVVGVTDKRLAAEPWFIEAGHMFPAALDPDTRAVHLLPPRAGTVDDVDGVSELAGMPGVVEHQFTTARREVTRAQDNNTYLGHVMVVAAAPGAPGATAEGLIGGLGVRYAEEAVSA